MKEKSQPPIVNGQWSMVKSNRQMGCRITIIFLCVLLLSLSTIAQKVSLIADRNKILIGEQVTLQLKAEDINTGKSFLQSWLNIADTGNHLQVTKRGPIDTIDINGLTTYLQPINITSFDSGNWRIPSIKMILQERTTGKQTILQTDSLTIEVLPVDVSALTNYHEIKDILDVQVQPNYWLYAAVAASVILLVIIIWLTIKQRKKKPIFVKPLYSGTALEHALQLIKELQYDAAQKENPKLFYTKLSAICREYFQDRLQVRSSQATSDELMLLLGVYLQDEKSRTAFYQLLRLSDAVKFAKYIPESDQNKQAIETAVKTLQHIDALTQYIKQHA